MPIAWVWKPRGARGAVTARILGDLPGAFDGLREVLLQGEGVRRRLRVEEARPYGGKVVFRFRGIASDPEARKLSGATISRRAGEFVDLGHDSYYISQLVGCRVELRDGTPVGEVWAVVRTGGTDLLSLRSPRGEVLIPLCRSICTRIDPDHKIIRLEPPDGLLELNAV